MIARLVRFSSRPPRGQEGFTMVEFLMAAFILAIGLLGLAALQILALRSAGTSRGMTTSVLVADGVTERIATEADQSYLGMIFSSAPIGKTRYIGSGKAPVAAGVNPSDPVPTDAIVDYFDAGGLPLKTATGAFFTASTWIDNQTKGNGSTGQTDVFRVRVVFNDAPNPANPGTFLTHAVNVTRTVMHA